MSKTKDSLEQLSLLEQQIELLIAEHNKLANEQTDAIMKDSNGEELDRELDDRIFDTFEQVIHSDIDRLNQPHSEDDVRNFMEHSIARENWLDGDTELDSVDQEILTAFNKLSTTTILDLETDYGTKSVDNFIKVSLARKKWLA